MDYARSTPLLIQKNIAKAMCNRLHLRACSHAHVYVCVFACLYVFIMEFLCVYVSVFDCFVCVSVCVCE